MRIRLDIPLTLGEIAEACSGVCKEELKGTPVEYLSTDTRELCPEDLFVAIKGEKFDGNDYVGKAIELGAIPLSSVETDVGITVTDSSLSLIGLARLYKSKLPNLKKVCGITGSIGKSTTKEFAAIIISEHFSVTKSIGNFNNAVGMCLSILSAKKNTEVLILEMGMNAHGEISLLSKTAEPDIAVITSVGTSHIGRLGSREEIARAKLEILDGMKEGKLIVPADEALLCRPSAISFSTKNHSSDYYLKGSYGRFDLYYKERWLFDGSFAISEGHLLECLSAALALACEMGVPISKLRTGVQKINRSSLRQRFEKAGSLTLYSDCYNSSLESATAALEYISSLCLYQKRSAVLGSVMELGGMSETIHKKIGEAAARAGCRWLYLVGESAQYMADGAVEHGFSPKNIRVFPDQQAISLIAEEVAVHSLPGELILFKGSRAMRLELVIERIKEILKDKEE